MIEENKKTNNNDKTVKALERGIKYYRGAMYTMYVAVNEKGEVKKELKGDNEIGGVEEKKSCEDMIT